MPLHPAKYLSKFLYFNQLLYFNLSVLNNKIILLQHEWKFALIKILQLAIHMCLSLLLFEEFSGKPFFRTSLTTYFLIFLGGGSKGNIKDVTFTLYSCKSTKKGHKIFWGNQKTHVSRAFRTPITRKSFVKCKAVRYTKLAKAKEFGGKIK